MATKVVKKKEMENLNLDLAEEEEQCRKTCWSLVAWRFGWTRGDRKVLKKGMYDLGQLHQDWYALLAKGDSVVIEPLEYDRFKIAKQLSSKACQDICNILLFAAQEGRVESTFHPANTDELLNSLTPATVESFFHNKPNRVIDDSVIAAFIHRTNVSHRFDLDIWKLQELRGLKGPNGDNIEKLRRELATQTTLEDPHVCFEFLCHMDDVFACIDESNGRVTHENIQNRDMEEFAVRHNRPRHEYYAAGRLNEYHLLRSTVLAHKNDMDMTEEEWDRYWKSCKDATNWLINEI